MSKFNKGKKKGMQAVSTASLPDIVFMLLFFFMVTTVMREQDVVLKIEKPNASEIVKIKKKDLVDYINIGIPNNTAKYGTEPVIQLDDAIATLDKIRPWVENNREERDEMKRAKIVTSLKVDKATKMRIVTNVKQELRHANSLKINYSSMAKARTVSKQ